MIVHRRPGSRLAPLVLGLALALVAAPGAALAKNPKLELLLRDPSDKVRIKAALGLGVIRDKDGVPALSVALAKDPVPAVRVAAASALGKIADISAKAALTAALRDPDVSVRDFAGKALKLLKIPGPPKMFKKTYFVELGDVLNKAKGKEALTGHYKSFVTNALRAHSTDFLWDRAAAPDGLTFSGAIKSVKRMVEGAVTLVEVKLTLVVTTNPGKAIVTVSDAEAAVGLEGSVSASEEESLTKEALEAAVEEAFKGCVIGIRAKE